MFSALVYINYRIRCLEEWAYFPTVKQINPSCLAYASTWTGTWFNRGLLIHLRKNKTITLDMYVFYYMVLVIFSYSLFLSLWLSILFALMCCRLYMPLPSSTEEKNTWARAPNWTQHNRIRLRSRAMHHVKSEFNSYLRVQIQQLPPLKLSFSFDFYQHFFESWCVIEHHKKDKSMHCVLQLIFLSNT